MDPKRKMVVLVSVIVGVLLVVAIVGVSVALVAKAESDRRVCEMYEDMTGGDPSTC